jgi:hypothetical protein
MPTISHFLPFFALVLAFSAAPLAAQTDTTAKKNKYPNAIVVDVSYGAMLPYADMRTTYKYALGLGLKVNYISSNNWIFSASGDYLFSDRIRIDVVKNLREANGYIIDQQGALADVKEGLRGFMILGGVGRLFPFNMNKNRRFGLEVRLHAGYIRHWVRIKFGGEELQQLMGDYRQGYDRKSDGFMLQQYIGLRYMSSNRLSNFFAGFDITQGFTRNRRLWNYDEMRADTDPKLDILAGFRVGICIPFNIYNSRTETLDDVKYY